MTLAFKCEMCDKFFDGEVVAELKARPYAGMQPNAIKPKDLCGKCYKEINEYIQDTKASNFVVIQQQQQQQQEESKPLEEILPDIEQEEGEKIVEKKKKQSVIKPADAAVNMSRADRIKLIREGIVDDGIKH